MTLREQVAAKGLRWVAARGQPLSPIWYVGEAPGEQEEIGGFAFIGPSGKELGRMIAEGGLDPNTGYYTNPYPVRPPNNELDKLEGLGIPKQAYEDWFFAELKAYQPKLIVPVGATAARILCPDTVPRRKTDDKGYIHKWMGSLLRSPLLPWEHYIVPNLHPAYILRSWGERVVAVLIFAKIKEELDFLKVHACLEELPIRNIKYRLAPDQIVEELRGLDLGPLAFDIEMLNYRFPYTLALASDPWTAIAFKLWGHTERVGREIFREVDRIFRTLPLIGQNCLTFDANWLNSLGLSVNAAHTDDIMVMHHVLWPELRHRLAFTTMQYTREPYYKEDGRRWTAKDSLDRLLLYNGKDACVTYEIFWKQKEEMNV